MTNLQGRYYLLHNKNTTSSEYFFQYYKEILEDYPRKFDLIKWVLIDDMTFDIYEDIWGSGRIKMEIALEPSFMGRCHYYN